MNKEAPRSFHDQTGGMKYFPRMLSKIRLFAEGRLRGDCHANLGKFADAACCSFLHISYDALKTRVLAGGSDEEILEWCFTQGRRLAGVDLTVWNEFIRKRGWNDEASGRLSQWKQESGHAQRDDLVTIPDYTDVLEGRKP